MHKIDSECRQREVGDIRFAEVYLAFLRLPYFRRKKFIKILKFLKNKKGFFVFFAYLIERVNFSSIRRCLRTQYIEKERSEAD